MASPPRDRPRAWSSGSSAEAPLTGPGGVLDGSRWRALPAGKIAGSVLAVLRCDQRPGDLTDGNQIHRTTVTRCVREVVGLLAARAPRLNRALKEITGPAGACRSVGSPGGRTSSPRH